MKPPAFGYHDPRSIESAATLLASLPNARVLAGGQSLMPMLNMRVVLPDHLVDLNRIAELSGLTVTDEELIVGAMTRQRDLEFSADVARLCPIIVEALSHVGHRQTRNRGTIGGSLCHLDPAAELPSVALALDATIEIASARGRRIATMADFAVDAMTNSLEADEFVTAIRLPLWPAGHGYSFQEFARRHGDFALAGIAVLLTKDTDGRITRCAVVLAGVGPGPKRMHDVEQALIGKIGHADLFKQVSRSCANLDVQEDIHAPASYRRRLAGVMMRRGLQSAFDRASA